MKVKTKKNNIGLLLLGGILFIMGVFGIVLHYENSKMPNLEQVLPVDTVVYFDIHLSDQNLQNISLNFADINFEDFLDNLLVSSFSFNFKDDVKSWVGNKIGGALLKDGNSVFIFEYKKRKLVEQFVQNFKNEDESFVITHKGDFKIFSPKFSSNFAFAYLDGSLIIATDIAVFDQLNLKRGHQLRDNVDYKKIRQDLSKNVLGFNFVDFEALLKQDFIKNNFDTSLYPLFETFVETVYAGGFVVNVEAKSLKVNSKFLTHKGVFNDHRIEKVPNNLMPKLASMVPKDVLFFMNGTDLYAKYIHTKQFLENLNPQFPVIFDGLLRAQSREIFGKDFDLETDFLAKMRGDYAFVINFEEALYPFLDVTFITGLKAMDKIESLSEFHDAIHFAQSQFAPVLEEVELPNGKVREELVAVPPAEVPIKKVEYLDENYYMAENPVSHKKFSYGLIDRYFVFSSHEAGLTSLLEVRAGNKMSLAENANFRGTVLFDFSVSESYGFINFSKFLAGISLFKNEIKNDNVAFEFFEKNILNVVFARKNFPEASFLDFVIFTK
jgi:hypothetical protein